MLAFSLGREWRLSIAEILATFPRAKLAAGSTPTLAWVDNVSASEAYKRFPFMGGSIRVLEVLGDVSAKTYAWAMERDIIERAKARETQEGKFPLAISVVGALAWMEPFKVGLATKRRLARGANPVNIRLLNKDDKPIHTALALEEHVDGRGGEYVLAKQGETLVLLRTIARQDIRSYTNRDTMKSRDMSVGMMPPKLVQILMNLAQVKDSVWDPFCGMGTTLIEATHQNLATAYGSDKDITLAGKAQINANAYQERAKRSTYIETFVADVTRLSAVLAGERLHTLAATPIVSEGYLGRAFLSNEVVRSAVDEERRKSVRLVATFLEELRRIGYDATIAMTFPFWELPHKAGTVFIEELPAIFREQGFAVVPLLPAESIGENTIPGLSVTFPWKRESLLYRREDQAVGREIFVLKPIR